MTAILLLHLVASYYYIAHQNITYDEPQYISYSHRWLHGQPQRITPLDDSKSPVVAIAWLPRIVRQLVNPNYQLTDYGRKDQKEGRYMMIFFSLLAALYVYAWCRELYGGGVWVLVLVLLLFDPLFLAYSTLISTDLASGAFLLALLFHYRKYLLWRSQKHFYLAALFTGIGVVTKQSMLFVLLLLPLLSICFYASQKQIKSLFKWKLILSGVWFLFLVLLFINVAYYFYHTGKPFGEYVFESHAMQNLQQQFHFLSGLPVPLPEPYVTSIDMIKAHAELGPFTNESTYAGVYMFGKLHEESLWYYYLVLVWYKMPIGTLLLLASCVILLFKDFDRNTFSTNYLFLLFPILFYAIVLSFFNRFQTGIRHLLIIYPLIFTGIGYVFYWTRPRWFTHKMLAVCLVLLSLISTAFYYPYIIPYANEFVARKRFVYKKILDTSIDYGQSDSSINGFIQQHPSYKKPPLKAAAGNFIIPMRSVYNELYSNQRDYEWLKNFEPVGVYRKVLLLYEIKKSDLEGE